MIMDELFKPGLTYQLPKTLDYVLGGVSGLDVAPVLASGDWRPFVSEHEKQKPTPVFDPLDCTAFAATNVLEALFFKQYARKLNFSDRALAFVDGNTVQGNTLSAPAEAIRKIGLCLESTWPAVGFTEWDKYYVEPSDAAKAEMAEFVKTYNVGWEWCYGDWKEALKLSPLAVALPYAYESSKDEAGVYHFTGGPVNHSVCLLFIDEMGYKYIQDTYETPVKKLDPSYPISYGLRYSLGLQADAPKPMPYAFQEGFRYFLNDAGGATLFFFAGKLRKDDLAKCLDQWFGRNDGDVKGKSVTITLNELKDVELFNLKGELTTL